ncbi:MAG: nitrite reductase small subunit NirD [Chitinophagaceae bacterium]
MKKELLITKELTEETNEWFRACRVEAVPKNGAVCAKYHQEQIAVFYFAYREEWFATQNLCPHRQQMSLSCGLLGDSSGEPKVACPFHKKTFSLRSGTCLSDPGIFKIQTYPVKI